MAKHNATGATKEVVDPNQKALAWAALLLENEAEAKRGFGGKTTSDYAKRLRATAKRLRQIAEPRWIPVSEQLPVGEGLVLVSTTKGGCVFIAGFLLPEKEWYFADIGASGVTKPLRSVSHWMPLPKKPKASSRRSKSRAR